MSIQPMDLQTLFMRLSQVGKDQAVMKEATHLAQAAQGSEIAKKSEEQASTVNETRELENGPSAVSEEGEAGARKNHGKQKQSEDEKEQAKRNVFQDPELGTQVDLNG